MAIFFEEKSGIFTLNTANTTYQMRIDRFGILQHLYYGAKIQGDTAYLVQNIDRGWGGTIADSGADRSYTLESLPREYPGIGMGDFRSHALSVSDSMGAECCDLRYVGYTVTKGKYALPGLPAAHAGEQKAESLCITLKDSVSGLSVDLPSRAF